MSVALWKIPVRSSPCTVRWSSATILWRAVVSSFRVRSPNERFRPSPSRVFAARKPSCTSIINFLYPRVPPFSGLSDYFRRSTFFVSRTQGKNAEAYGRKREEKVVGWKKREELRWTMAKGSWITRITYSWYTLCDNSWDINRESYKGGKWIIQGNRKGMSRNWREGKMLLGKFFVFNFIFLFLIFYVR